MKIHPISALLLSGMGLFLTGCRQDMQDQP